MTLFCIEKGVVKALQKLQIRFTTVTGFTDYDWH